MFALNKAISTNRRKIFSIIDPYAVDTIIEGEGKEDNPLKLVVESSKKIENLMTSLGLTGGNGILSKIAPYKIDSFIKRRLLFIASVRNKAVHGNFSASSFSEKGCFNKNEFIRATTCVEKYLQELKTILKDDEFLKSYYPNHFTEGAVIDLAVKFRCLREVDKIKASLPPFNVNKPQSVKSK